MRSCSTKYLTTLRSSRSVPGVSASRFAWFSRILEEAIAQAVPRRCLLVSTTVDRLVRSGEAAQELVDMTSSAGRHSPQLQQGKRNANRVSHEGGECAGDIQQTSRSHRQYGRVDCQNLRSVEASGGFFTRSQDEGNVTALSNNWADRFPDGFQTIPVLGNALLLRGQGRFRSTRLEPTRRPTLGEVFEDVTYTKVLFDLRNGTASPRTPSQSTPETSSST